MIYEIKTPQQDEDCRSVEQSFSFSIGRRDMIGNKEINSSYFMRGAENVFLLFRSMYLKRAMILIMLYFAKNTIPNAK